MLFRGSLVFFSDNSGGLSIKILKFDANFKKKPVGKISSIFLGIIMDHNPLKKKILLKKKSKSTAMLVATKKKYSKKNLIFIYFSQNRAISLKITRFINPVPNYIFTSIFFELKFFKKFKTVFLKSYAFF